MDLTTSLDSTTEYNEPQYEISLKTPLCPTPQVKILQFTAEQSKIALYTLIGKIYNLCTGFVNYEEDKDEERGVPEEKMGESEDEDDDLAKDEVVRTSLIAWDDNFDDTTSFFNVVIKSICQLPPGKDQKSFLGDLKKQLTQQLFNSGEFLERGKQDSWFPLLYKILARKNYATQSKRYQLSTVVERKREGNTVSSETIDNELPFASSNTSYKVPKKAEVEEIVKDILMYKRYEEAIKFSSSMDISPIRTSTSAFRESRTFWTRKFRLLVSTKITMIKRNIKDKATRANLPGEQTPSIFRLQYCRKNRKDSLHEYQQEAVEFAKSKMFPEVYTNTPVQWSEDRELVKLNRAMNNVIISLKEGVSAGFNASQNTKMEQTLANNLFNGPHLMKTIMLVINFIQIYEDQNMSVLLRAATMYGRIIKQMWENDSRHLNGNIESSPSSLVDVSSPHGTPNYESEAEDYIDARFVVHNNVEASSPSFDTTDPDGNVPGLSSTFDIRDLNPNELIYDSEDDENAMHLSTSFNL